MKDTLHESQQLNGLAHVEDVVNQHNVDWRAIARLACRRDQEGRKKRKQILRMLSTVGRTLPEIQNFLSVTDLAAVEMTVEVLANVIQNQKTRSEKSLPPSAPYSPT